MPKNRETFRRLSNPGQTVIAFRHVYWLEYREAHCGLSRADFISKYAIALKEARETIYWLRLIQETASTKDVEMTKLILEAEEISKIIGAIIVNTKWKTPNDFIREGC